MLSSPDTTKSRTGLVNKKKVEFCLESKTARPKSSGNIEQAQQALREVPKEKQSFLQGLNIEAPKGSDKKPARGERETIRENVYV
jgi:hypothetical protein